MNIFVANFDDSVDEDELESLFKRHGAVSSVTIWRDWQTGESKGYGFVDMPHELDAEQAIDRIDGKWWRGRRLKACKARTQTW